MSGPDCEAALAVARLLKEKEDQCIGLNSKLEVFHKHFKEHDTNVKNLERQIEEKTEYFADKAIEYQESLESTVEKREKAKALADKMKEQLQEQKEKTAMSNGDKFRQEQKKVELMTNKLELFRNELERKTDAVLELQNKIHDAHDSATTGEIAKLRAQLKVQQHQRDEWRESFLGIRRQVNQNAQECQRIRQKLAEFRVNLGGTPTQEESAETRVLTFSDDDGGEAMTALQKELAEVKRQRDEWQEKTNTIVKLLNEKAGQNVGLETRRQLFMREFKMKEESIAVLDKKLQQEKKNFQMKMVNIKKEMELQNEQHAKREDGVERLSEVLKSQEEIRDNVAAKLKLSQEELQRCERENASPAQREKWRSTVQEMKQQSAEEQGKVSATAGKLELFKGDLDRRKDRIMTLAKEAKASQEVIAKHAADGKRQVEALEQERDKWYDNTKEIDRLLRDNQGQSQGLNTRLSLFRLEQAKFDDAVQILELKVALQDKREDRDKWNNQTVEIERFLNERKSQRVGLLTRQKLFKRELDQREDLKKQVEDKIAEKRELFDLQVEPLTNSLREFQHDVNQWLDNTNNVDRLLRERNGQILGLNTRLALFNRELELREERVAALEKKFKEIRVGAYQTEMILKELRAEQEQRDEWKTKTADLKKLLCERKNQATGLRTRLELFKRELDMRKERVAGVEAKLNEREKGFSDDIADLTAELKAHQDQCDHWQGNVDNVENLLKENETQRLGLTTRRALFRQELGKKEEAVEILQGKLDELTGTVTKKQEPQRAPAKPQSRSVRFSAHPQDRDPLPTEKPISNSFRAELNDKMSALEKKLQEQKKINQEHKNESMKQVSKLTAMVDEMTHELKCRDEKVKAVQGGVKEASGFAQEMEQLKSELQEKAFRQNESLRKLLEGMNEQCINLASKMEALTKELKVRDEQNELLEKKVKQSEAAMEAYRAELKAQQQQHQQLLQNKLNVAMSEIQNLVATSRTPADSRDISESSIMSQMSLM